MKKGTEYVEQSFRNVSKKNTVIINNPSVNTKLKRNYSVGRIVIRVLVHVLESIRIKGVQTSGDK